MEEIIKKIAFIGDGGVGKTYLIDKLNNKRTTRKYIPTENIKTIIIKNENNLFFIDDHAGQEKYNGKIIIGYDIVFIMYDQKNNISKRNINFWKQKCKHNKKIVIINREYDIENIKKLLKE